MRRIDAVTSRPASRRAGYAKSRDTRARILAATLEEARDAGLQKASVARIAARAGVAVGNLNYHFGSRGELLRELMASLMADLLPRLHAADADDSADFFERERASLLAYLDYLRANPAHVRLAGEIRLCEPDLYRRAVAGWVERIAARIRAGIARGTLRRMDNAKISTLAHFVLGASQFLDHMLENADGPRYPGDEAVVDTFVALLRCGLGRTFRGRNGNRRRSGRARARSGAAAGPAQRRRTSRSRWTRGKR